jgi:phosphoglycolate phosphatase-like HAD superfamily hydrolase
MKNFCCRRVFWLIIDTSQQGAQQMAKITRVSIYDMDGTIVDSLHRYRTIIDENGERIDLGYWRENEYRAMDDTLLPLAQQYKSDLLDENCYVIIATARVLRSADNTFIREVLGEPDYIISRTDGDTISGGKLKIAGLAKFFNLVTFRDAEFTFYEDNVDYLKAVCDRFNIRGVYVPSKQGH